MLMTARFTVWDSKFDGKKTKKADIFFSLVPNTCFLSSPPVNDKTSLLHINADNSCKA